MVPIHHGSSRRGHLELVTLPLAPDAPAGMIGAFRLVHPKLAAGVLAERFGAKSGANSAREGPRKKECVTQMTGQAYFPLERTTGFEPATPTLAR